MIFIAKHVLLLEATLQTQYRCNVSGVINLQTMRIAITAGEMNNLKIMVGDVSYACLEASNQEKV
jgi:hypothetical protein